MEIDFRSLGSSTIETEKFFWSWLIYDSTEKIASDRSNHKDITNFGYNSGDNKNNNNYYYLSSLRTLTQGQCDQIEPLMAIWATLWSLWEFIGPNRPIFEIYQNPLFFWWKLPRQFFYKNGPFPASFSLCSSIQYSWQYMFNIFFANNWIQTTDFWNWKRPLYQLSHINCHDNFWATFHSTLLVTLLKDGMWSF